MPSIKRPEFLPDPSLDHDEMKALQRAIATAATFADDHELSPGSIGSEQSTLGSEAFDDEGDSNDADGLSPIVAGVDQAFLDDDRAVSAVVAMQDGTVIEEVTATEPVRIPYIPGLLAFREGGSIASALSTLSVEPDLLLVDGSGRIHFREAGLATHVGALFDIPAIGVAKSLLCGDPTADSSGLSPGDRVPIEADDSVTAPEGTVIGHALQTRQFDSPNRHVNPVYVSPGHRVGADAAAAVALAACDGYKLPEPIRLADRLAGEHS